MQRILELYAFKIRKLKYHAKAAVYFLFMAIAECNERGTVDFY